MPAKYDLVQIDSTTWMTPLSKRAMELMPAVKAELTTKFTTRIQIWNNLINKGVSCTADQVAIALFNLEDQQVAVRSNAKSSCGRYMKFKLAK